MSDFGEQVRQSIRTYTADIVRRTVEGTLAEEEAARQLYEVIDMAVRRDPGFAEAVGIDHAIEARHR